jgi:transmembrane sensor
VTTIPIEVVQDRLSWREGRLVFVDQPLSEVADQFNRYASTRLTIADARAGAVRISGSFYYTGSGEFADALQGGFGLSVERRSPSEWVIRSPS